MSLSYHRLEPYRLFLRGYRTDEIAKLLRVSEAWVERQVTIARCAAKGLPYPYPPYSWPSESILTSAQVGQLKDAAAALIARHGGA